MKRNNNNHEYYFGEEFEDERECHNCKFSLEQIKELFEEVLLRYGLIDKSEPIKIEWVSIKQLCEEFGISRQTLNNWSKHRYFKVCITPHKKYLGKRWVYDIEGMRSSLIKNGPGFGLRSNVVAKLKKEKSFSSDLVKRTDCLHALKF